MNDAQLNAAQEALAAHIKATTSNVDPIMPAVPGYPTAWAGYVWPASDWINTDTDDGTFCLNYSVGLVVDLIAGLDELPESQRWLNARVEEVLLSSADGVEVLPGEIVQPVSAQIVGIVRSDQGAEVLVARIEFSRFTLEES